MQLLAFGRHSLMNRGPVYHCPYGTPRSCLQYSQPFSETGALAYRLAIRGGDVAMNRQ
jgi:hypothetical protein